MPTFDYVARDMTGNKMTGQLEAANKDQAMDELLQREYVPITIDQSKQKTGGSSLFKKKVKAEEIILFCRQLHTMLRAGIGIVTSLHSLRLQVSNPTFKKVIDSLHKDVNEGSSLSAAMEKHPNIFSNVFVSTIKVGEEGGILDEILEKMIDLLEHEAGRRSCLCSPKIRGLLR
jgi:type II secretory pathway component PulF